MYELVPITSVPNGQKVVGARLVYKINTDGAYKGRLVVLGWSQVRGIYCGGTFVPVCRLKSIRMVLAIAAELDYEIYMVDVQTPFLNADVEEEAFVEMAPGHERSNKFRLPLVMKLSLRGREWLSYTDALRGRCPITERQQAVAGQAQRAVYGPFGDDGHG